MLRILCAGRNPLLAATRGLMLQSAGFATDVAIGTKAAMAAVVGRHVDIVVLCHTFTEQERHLLQIQLSERAPWAHVLNLENLETDLSYTPCDFIRTVGSQVRCA